MAIEICSTIKGLQMDIRKVPGTILSNQSNGEVIYTPPVGEAKIRRLLTDWETFLHADDGIDPFIDGNGRAGRILNVLYLIEAGLLTLPILNLSQYIVQNKHKYYH